MTFSPRSARFNRTGLNPSKITIDHSVFLSNRSQPEQSGETDISTNMAWNFTMSLAWSCNCEVSLRILFPAGVSVWKPLVPLVEDRLEASIGHLSDTSLRLLAKAFSEWNLGDLCSIQLFIAKDCKNLDAPGLVPQVVQRVHRPGHGHFL